MKPCVFVIANEHIPKEAMTVSTTAHMGKADPVHYFTTARSFISEQADPGNFSSESRRNMSQSGKTRSFMWRPGHSAAPPEGRTDSCIQKSY